MNTSGLIKQGIRYIWEPTRILCSKGTSVSKLLPIRKTYNFSNIAQLYDPLGIIGIVIVLGEIMM